MYKHTLQHVLVALLCLQAILYAVDVHAIHQSIDSHTFNTSILDADTTVTQSDVSCEHCCHCHGGNSGAYHTSSMSDNPLRETNYQEFAILTHIKRFTPPPLRPPISC